MQPFEKGKQKLTLSDNWFGLIVSRSSRRFGTVVEMTPAKKHEN